jgi:hypothetical protein
MTRISPCILSLLVAFACGADDGASPGTELGPCIQGQFCTSPLQCIDEICVDPDQLGDSGDAGSFSTTAASSISEGSGTAETSGGTGTMTGAGSASGADTGNVPEIHCTTDPTVGCFCSHNADYGPTGVACSPAELPPPASCCASEGWPSFGGCSCWTYSCRMSEPDFCYCGPGQPEPTDTPVESCVAPSNGVGPGGGVCCNDPDLGTCACYADLSTCLEGDLQVSSCTTASILCGPGDTAVAACN